MMLTRAFFAWFGGGGGTLLTNDFDVTEVFMGAQTLVATTVVLTARAPKWVIRTEFRAC